jgi:hypothetical protein
VGFKWAEGKGMAWGVGFERIVEICGKPKSAIFRATSKIWLPPVPLGSRDPESGASQRWDSQYLWFVLKPMLGN